MTTTPRQSDARFEIGLVNRAGWRSSCRVMASLRSTDPLFGAGRGPVRQRSLTAEPLDRRIRRPQYALATNSSSFHSFPVAERVRTCNVFHRRRFAMLIKVPSKETEAVVAALSQHVRKLPATLKRSLTWDRGLEMAKHKDFTVATDVQVYFWDPQSPWQRGTNENTNLLLRQYFPRGTDLSGYSQAQLDQVSLRLNQRPRKTLGFQTPASKLHASVASTV
jgi:hypothetical protein